MFNQYKEPVGYFISTFLFSWAFWIPAAVIFMNTNSTEDLTTSPLFIALQTMGAAGPSIVAYFFVRKFHGKQATKSIVDRYKIWRVNKKWYFASIFLIVFISLFSLLIHHLFLESPFVEGHPLYDMFGDLRWAVLLVLPVIFVAQIFSSPLLEEFGWRGYAQPLLQKKMSVLSSSVIIGLIWGVWHLPLILAYDQSIFVSVISTICHSIIIGWILNSTRGSMLMVLLFHASLNVGLNILAPGHDDLILLGLTVLVTVFVIYKIKKDKLQPFHGNENRDDSLFV